MMGGDSSFVKMMKVWLRKTLDAAKLGKDKVDSIIELCAGMGGNFDVISKFTRQIVGVEMVPGNLKSWPKQKINGAKIEKEVSKI